MSGFVWHQNGFNGLGWHSCRFGLRYMGLFLYLVCLFIFGLVSAGGLVLGLVFTGIEFWLVSAFGLSWFGVLSAFGVLLHFG